MTRVWKYHGSGNDFVLVDRRGRGDVDAQTTRRVCDRHTGIGADGILALLETGDGRPFMRVFNSDGSVADMCGNGLRCFVRWLVEDLGRPAEPMLVGTDAGDQRCEPIARDGVIVAVGVGLGPPRHAGRVEVPLGDGVWLGHGLFLGNPHFVIERAPAADEVATRGPDLSTHERFVHGTNVEWLEVLSPTEANVTVYERGAGLTRACGTGGAGAVAVGAKLGRLAVGEPVLVHQPGGDLSYRVEADTGRVWMTGPAEPVFSGETSLL